MSTGDKKSAKTETLVAVQAEELLQTEEQVKTPDGGGGGNRPIGDACGPGRPARGGRGRGSGSERFVNRAC